MGQSFAFRPASSESGVAGDLVAAGNGDLEAFAQLYAQLAGTVLGAVRAILRDNAHAEEITAAIFVEVWRTACQYSPDRGGGFEWVMAIAHRHAVDRLRADAEARSPRDRRWQAAEVRPPNTAQARLQGLAPLERESLELAYYGGLTYTEIGAVHHIPASSAKSLLRDALINLRGRG
ncbi:sigma-70 family RNA polymerase sigma factor [Kibdelosporangium phytohabitans]|uniref:RNA polymerase subunit sigma n=1 Tax=Kibdelosporangium phytohabitans TaxID=860235 RepID=A0A0N9I528_9PSEU|nr:sigma-70 family RNA polymerase sigma factor [Kibdelosporangium phytohabitans]ALG09950.1 hypothetical protein AOZ06_26340 [Kibdelosporangium phytohabitans]MBE1468638.1 RNA polymerase sigma-70 factor (ECF subfamily) [Kibdelosporangium phytohabitans]